MEQLIYEILDSQNERCPNCGGTFLNGECKYCGISNTKSDDLIKKLEEIISQKQEFSKDDIIALSLLEKYDIEKLNNILKGHNFSSSEMIDINKKELNIFDTKELIAVCSNKLVSEEKESLFNSVILKSIYLNAKNGEKVDKLFAKAFIENLFREICKKLNVESSTLKFTDLEKEDGCHGRVDSKDNVQIDPNRIQSFIDGDIMALYGTLLHELTHIGQNGEVKTKDFDVMTLIKVFDKIISKNSKDYYDENYSYLSTECEAFYVQTVYTDEMLKGIGLTELIREENKEKIDILTKNYNNISRKKDGNLVSVVEIAKDYIGINDYNNYPILRKFYKINNNEVILKDREEFIIENKDNENFIKFYDNYLANAYFKEEEASIKK